MSFAKRELERQIELENEPKCIDCDGELDTEEKALEKTLCFLCALARDD